MIGLSMRMAQRQRVIDALNRAIEADDPRPVRSMLDAVLDAGGDQDLQRLLRAAVSVVSDPGLEALDRAAGGAR